MIFPTSCHKLYVYVMKKPVLLFEVPTNMKPLPVVVQPLEQRSEGGLSWTEPEFCNCDTDSGNNTKWPNRFRQYQNDTEDDPKVF